MCIDLGDILSLPILAPLFQGEFKQYANIFRLPAGNNTALPASVLLDPSFVKRQLALFRPDCDESLQAEVLSEWSKYYFIRMLAPVIAANVLLGHALPVRLSELELIFGKDGTIHGFVVEDQGAPIMTTGVDSYESLVEDNLKPLIESWSLHFSVPIKILWVNAARYVNWINVQLDEAGMDAEIGKTVKQLLEHRYINDKINPMFGCYRLRRIADKPVQVRRNCCLRYRLPTTELCDDCPRLLEPK